MSRKLLGLILLLVLGSAAIVGTWLLLPYLEDREQRSTSDAVRLKGSIRVALDNWIGYFPLRSREMRSAMHRLGWQLVIEDDQADYVGRMERLRKGELDLAVGTVDSFILTGQKASYPATIIAVLDESKGGDSIVARADKVGSLSQIKERTDLRVAFTPNSPSHHLLKATVDHFNLPELLPRGPGRVETNGSAEALQKLLSGKADLAVLWEPDVSQALSHPELVKILGTEDTIRLIVDILVVSREFSRKHPEAVSQLLKTYFRVLKKYRDNPDQLTAEVREETKLSEEVVRVMLKGVSWVNFGENCENWFGVTIPGNPAREDLLETIESTASILMAAGDFSHNPVPDEDPYRLVNSSYLETLYTQGMAGFTPQGGQANVNSSLETRFSPLDEQAWNRLKEVGALKVEPIVFQSGSSELNMLSKQILDRSVDRLKHYPHFRIMIKGHTGTRGATEENRKLSQERAEAVAKYLEITYNIDPNRMRPKGFGGEQPLNRLPGESLRAFEYRLPRVELVLVREDL